MVTGSPTSLLDTVRRRWDVLEVLSFGSSDKAELVSSVDVSRSTVNRAVRELEETGLIERSSGTFHLTVVGRLMVQLQRDVESTVGTLTEARRVLEPLDGAFTPSSCLFHAATVIDDEEDDAMEFLVDQIRGAERLTAVHGPRRMDMPATVRDLLVCGPLDAELLLSEPALEWFQTYHVDEQSRSHDIEISSLDDAFPYALLLSESDGNERVTLITYDESSTLVGVVSNETPEAVAWARNHLDAVREEATPVSACS